MEINEMLAKLCVPAGVSGAEEPACEAALELLREYVPDAVTDDFGCVCGFLGDRENGKPTLLLEAHIDEIGFIVTYIDEKGFIKAASCGGTDNRLYAAQTVTIHGKYPIKGVIATLPPHVSSGEKKPMKTDEMVIDAGYSAEKLRETVSLGDRITIDGEFGALGEKRVTGKALDDRSGVAAVLYALSLLKGKELPFNISVLFASQEEVGSRGAIMGAYRACADYAIATDVSFAHTPDAPKEKCGKMGAGTMIGVSPSLSKSVTARLRSLAEELGIPFQLEVMGSGTGTDADDIAVTRGGVKTGLVSIPLKYMHTPVEVVETADVEATGRLMAAFAERGVAE